MDWDNCFKEGIVVRVLPNVEKSLSMLRLANFRFEFFDVAIKEKFIFLKIEAWYDTIRELIFAHMYKNGYNCKNHLCLIAYLREKMFCLDEYEINKVDELRKVRNEISYRGFLIGKDYYKRNHLEIRSIIRKLKGSLK